MVVALVKFWVILVWVQMPSSTIDHFYLQALNLQRLPFFPKHHSKFQWRGGGSPTAASSGAATSTPRKYRHLDVQEEYSRERSGAFDQRIPYQWMDQITQQLKTHYRSDKINRGIDKFSNSPSFDESHYANASTSIPVLEPPIRKKKHQHLVSNVNELRSKILDDGLALQNLKIEEHCFSIHYQLHRYVF